MSFLHFLGFSHTQKVSEPDRRKEIASLIIPAFLPTDLDEDGTVNILDITVVAAAYNTKPSDPKWNAAADLDRNGTVNILDVTMVAKDYGKTL